MKKSLVVTVVLLSAAAGLLSVGRLRGTVSVSELRLNTLPMEMGGWKGESRTFDDKVYQALNADENLLRLYSRGPGEDIWLYIGYYGTQKGGRTGHLPMHCYPGSGWEIISQKRETLADGAGRPQSVNQLLVRKGPVGRLAYWWIHADKDKVLDTGLKMNLNRLKRRLTQNRDDGAFVRVSATVDNADPAKTEAALEDFSTKLLAVLPDYWPIEIETR
jgi:EpsI family protein